MEFSLPVGPVIIVRCGIGERIEFEVFGVVELAHTGPEVVLVRNDEPRFDRVGESGEFLNATSRFAWGV